LNFERKRFQLSWREFFSAAVHFWTRQYLRTSISAVLLEKALKCITQLLATLIERSFR
jgi:hypothetical protein